MAHKIDQSHRAYLLIIDRIRNKLIAVSMCCKSEKTIRHVKVTWINASNPSISFFLCQVLLGETLHYKSFNISHSFFFFFLRIVEFRHKEDAEKAIKELHGTDFKGRSIHIREVCLSCVFEQLYVNCG